METFWARLATEIARICGDIHFDTRAAAHAYLFEVIEISTIGNATTPAWDTSHQPSTRPLRQADKR